MARKDFYNLSEEERKAALASLFGDNYSVQVECGDIVAACGYYGEDVVEVLFNCNTIYIAKRTNTDIRRKRWSNSVANKVLKTEKVDFFSKETFARVNDQAIAMVQHEGYNLCVIYFYYEQKEESAA